ncbi:MAG: maleylacetoacetate isomerase [Betaproteobacteria bacterium RIFCSPLOWO2_02_FULL_67_26]|nr:MAG: maleylacetoacetate isomerase [Betaproteobacteria bacterium RIFCSPLOWO2_02_FULL_67_26]
MKYYGFWRSLAACRVRIALALKNIKAEEISVNLMQGEQLKPDYVAVNPLAVVPALIDDGGTPLFESMAIIEYLDETHPQPPLLPGDPRGRARVRGLAQIVACDGHPLIVPRVRNYLEKEFKIDEAARTRWCQHWIVEALKAVEAHLAKEKETGRYCHGDAVTLADVCVVTQVFGARFFNCDTAAIPTVMRIFNQCMTLEAFDKSQPLKQPGAPQELKH